MMILIPNRIISNIKLIVKYIITGIVFMVCFLHVDCKKDTPITPPDTAGDTTSHAFTWQTFTFGGDAGSCTLNDVAIINDTLAYAVGAVYLKDSSGNFDPNAYNLLKWNGHEWALMRIQFQTFCGQAYTGSYPTSAIVAFSDQDVWIASYSEIVRWNGKTQTSPDCLPISVNKLWGANSNSIYAVGNGGGIAHATNGVWQKIESGTDLQFLDIYGATDSKSGKEQILAVCTRNYPPGKGIFSIQGNTATEISSNIPGEQIAELFGVWFIPNRHYYIVGDGIYEKTSLTDSAWRNGPLKYTKYATTKIRANGLNDIFVVGSYGECLHWSGASWKSYIEQIGMANGGYASIAVKGNLVIAVGENNPQAVITIGRR
jgi:hypothetical protein